MEDYTKFNKEEFNRWVLDNGDSTLRLNYNLNSKSIIIDAGGYHGDWAQKIHNKYSSKILIFEPIKNYFNQISDRFSNNKDVAAYNFGLSNSEKEEYIYHTNDASSVFWGSGESELIQLKSFCDFVKSNKINTIDLMKINIEGGEYDLLDNIIENNLQYNIKNLQIQFHRFIPDCVERRNKIREKLSETHELTYDYEFIWENWKIKDDE